MKRFLKYLSILAVLCGVSWGVLFYGILVPDFEGEISQETSPLVVFDFDGTVADSFEEAVDIVNSLSAEYDFQPIPKSEYEKVRATSLRDTLKKMGLNIWQQFTLVKRFREIVESKGGGHLQPISGVKKVIMDLKEKGIRIGIATTNSGKVVKAFLAHHAFPSVDFVFSKGSLFGKSRLLKKIKKEAKNAIRIAYVGDELRDIAAGKEAGLQTIAVSWGFNTHALLATGKPDALVDAPGEIVGVVG